MSKLSDVFSGRRPRVGIRPVVARLAGPRKRAASPRKSRPRQGLRRRCPRPAPILAPAARRFLGRPSPNRRSRSAHPLKSPAERRLRRHRQPFGKAVGSSVENDAIGRNRPVSSWARKLGAIASLRNPPGSPCPLAISRGLRSLPARQRHEGIMTKSSQDPMLTSPN